MFEIHVDSAESFMSTVWKGYESKLTAVWDSAESLMSTVRDSMESKLTAVWDSAESLMRTVWESFESKLTAVWDSAESHLFQIECLYFLLVNVSEMFYFFICWCSLMQETD